MNILAIGAHPDDIDLGCSGAILYHQQQGDRVFALVMNNGARTADPALRLQEQVDSLQVLGVQDVLFCEMTSEEMAGQPATLESLRRYISKWEIDTLYVHYPQDSHNDHVHVARAAIPAARMVKNLLFYETPSTVEFYPTVCVNLDRSRLHKKLQAVRQHQSQVTRHACDLDLLHWVRVTSQFRGMQFRTELAEGFVSHRFTF